MSDFDPEVYAGLSGEATIAAELARSGAMPSAVSFLTGKLSGEGYADRLKDLPLGINHWRARMPQAWPTSNKPLSQYEQFLMKRSGNA